MLILLSLLLSSNSCELLLSNISRAIDYEIMLLTRNPWVTTLFLTTACSLPQQTPGILIHFHQVHLLLTALTATQDTPSDSLPYTITNCTSNTSGLLTILQTLNSSLQAAIQDLRRQKSSPAHTAFFKDIAYADTVRAILQNITLGTAFSPFVDTDYVALTPLAAAVPEFTCVTAPSQITWLGATGALVDAYTQCRGRLGG